MRTTLTLEPDVAQRLRERMAREKTTLKQTVNEVLRIGLKTPPARQRVKFKVKPWAFNFRPGIDLNKMNQLVDELEVEDYLRRNPR